MIDQLYLILIMAGALAGFLAGLMGIGGGIVSVPIMYWALGAMGDLGVDDALRMHTAVATSLLVIIPTSIRSARAHYLKGGVEVPTAKTWAAFIIIGALVGALIANDLDKQQLVTFFGVMLFLMALRLLLLAFKGQQQEGVERSVTGPFSKFVALFIGVASSLMGIGGASFAVPYLTLMGRPIQRAVGTASFFGLLIALPAVIGFAWLSVFAEGRALSNPWQVGYFNGLLFLFVAPLSILCAPYGVKMAHKISPKALSGVFGVFLMITSLRMMFGA